ncbi:MAG: T9SS type A sorting domain-containing protein [Candidatus Kapaibacterium sp.]
MKNFKNVIIAAVLILFVFGNAYAQVPHKLTATNFQSAGNEVQFDVFIQATTSTPLYLSVSDMAFDFNLANFENPVFAYINNSCNLKNSSGAPAVEYNNTISQYMSGNTLIINVSEMNINTQADFDNLVAKIDNTPMMHKIGRFSLSGITNPSGTLGMHWVPANTVILSYEPVKWAAVNNSDQSTYEITEDQPLPVVLQSFTAATVNERNVKLNWITGSELNNAGFEVERAEVRSQNLEFSKIGFINGHGTTNTPTNYSFEDIKLNTGKYNYRLKQVDNNGNFAYHKLNSEVEVGIPKKYNLSQNYPNPFNPVTKIDFDLPKDARVKITVFDILGREMKSIINEFRKAGYHTVTFNASGISSGTYFYRFETEGGNNIITKKLLLVK